MWELINNPSDHPLVNLKSARKLLDNLPKDNAANLLQEISHWVESISDADNNFNPAHQLDVLRLLDETAHPYLGRVVDSYFSVQALSEFQSNSLWLTLNEYLSRIAQAYLSIFRACKNGEKKSAAIKPHLTLITARGMHALAGKLKLSAVRYVAAEAEIWAMLSEFYAYAEAKGYLNDALSLYGDSKTETSVKNIFSALLMWQACEAGSLRPLQLHIAERIINYLGEHLIIGQQATGFIASLYG